VLRAQVAEQHDWTPEQHAKALLETTGVALKKSSVGNYLKRLGITHKKRASSRLNKSKASERATGLR
jgi:transposase